MADATVRDDMLLGTARKPIEGEMPISVFRSRLVLVERCRLLQVICAGQLEDLRCCLAQAIIVDLRPRSSAVWRVRVVGCGGIATGPRLIIVDRQLPSSSSSLIIILIEPNGPAS